MKPIFYCLLIACLLFTACSGKRYGHYSYSSKRTYKIAKFKKKRLKSSNLLLAKQSVLDKSDISDVSFVDTLTIPATEHTANKNTQPTDDIKKWQGINPKRFADTARVVEPLAVAKAQPHPYANAGMVLGILAIFASLFSLFYLPILALGFALGLAAFGFSNKALNEMKQNPGMYSNKGEAMTGFIIGSIYATVVGAAFLALLIYIIIYALLILFLNVIVLGALIGVI